MDVRRVRLIKAGMDSKGPVVYWMSRDQRAADNWALLTAHESAIENRQPLLVVFCVAPSFLDAAIRQYGFMLRGLEEVAIKLEKKNIPFFLLQGDPSDKIPPFLKKNRAGLLITDFDPLKIKREWKHKIASSINVPFYEVDAHNIVPCRDLSGKQEYGAYTIRPKLKRKLSEFLTDFPKLKTHPFSFKGKIYSPDCIEVINGLRVDKIAGEVKWIRPGEGAALARMREFISHRLSGYAEKRNDPNQNGQSGLSPYLHFGQLSAQRVALEVIKSEAPAGSKAAFLEELITRRELSDNFCLYNHNYDNPKGFPEWAKKTLTDHISDKRDYLYTPEQFERALTHDDLWNAAQREMVMQGKMHGYLSMYWAKKILEWTESPERAMEVAVYLNDRYELDGRDPNGYAGIAWSIGGVHDRAWSERPVFGKIRYMSYNGCRSKFDVSSYIKRNLTKNY
jgi:deoxyribodipyrimidine photo-lyase